MNEQGHLTKMELLRHVEEFWPRNRLSTFRWDIGPIKQSLPEFKVIRVEPLAGNLPWVYVSNGAWSVPTNVDYREEFLIIAPNEDPIHVESLAMVANFHSDPRYQIRLGSILSIGRGWVDGSKCNHFLISLPYPFGPRLEVFRNSSTWVEFLWLMPITPSEAAFAREHGVEQLERRFDDAAIDYKDPDRPSVV